VQLVDKELARYAAQGMALLGYACLLGGAYSRHDRPVPPEYWHPGTEAQLEAVRDTTARLGVTPNQVVLAWLANNHNIIPVLGVCSTEQLDEALASVRRRPGHPSRR